MKPALALAVSALCAAALAACGGDSAGGSKSLDDTLRYFPPDAPLVAVISTDLDSDQYAALDKKLDSLGVPGGVEDQLRDMVEEEEEGDERLSYDEDVKPLLGEDLVVGATSPAALGSGEGAIAAMDVGDPDKLVELIEGPFFELKRAGEAQGADLYRPKDPDDDTALALDDNTLLIADSSATLRAALERHGSEDGLDAERFSAAVKGLPEDAPLRVVASPEAAFTALPELDAAKAIPWVGAVRSAGAAVSVGDGGIVVDATVKTDSSGLSESDLPVAPGEERLELLERDGELRSASANQSVSTRALLKAVAAVYPDSQFERRRQAIEQQLDVKLDDLLALFDGASVSAQSPQGIVATRSEVSDPEALAAGLRKVAPRLPELAEALGPIAERTVLTAIRTIAPKLPIPGEGLDEPGVTVTPVRGERDLYTLSAADPRFSGPNEQVVFGVVGDVFVVAQDEASAKEIATAPTEPAEGLTGGAIFSADALFLSGLVGGDASQLPPSVEDLQGYVRASTDELTVHAELRIR